MRKVPLSFHYSKRRTPSQAILGIKQECQKEPSTKAYPVFFTYRGYRLLVCDGTDLNIARNPNDQENYFQSNPGEKGLSYWQIAICLIGVHKNRQKRQREGSLLTSLSFIPGAIALLALT